MAFNISNYQGTGPWGMAWPGCCCIGCLVHADNWSPCDPTPSTDDWDAVDGTWTIDKPDEVGEECSGQWLIGSGAGAMLICKHPTASYPQYVYVSIGDIAGSRPRILMGVDYNPLTSAVGSYCYLEFDTDNNKLTWGSATSDGMGGFTETVLRQISEDYSSDMYGWLSGGNGSEITFSGGWFNSCHFTGWVCTSRASGKYTGLMNGPAATAPAEFPGDQHYFFVGNHEDTPNLEDSQVCGYCDCQCDQYCVPRTLAYRLSVQDGSAPCCQGLSGDMEFDDNNPDLDYCTWALPELDTGCGYNTQFRLGRPADQGRLVPCEDWYLENNGWPGWNIPNGSPPAVCTCDPFYMRWDFSISYPGMDACLYRMEIWDPNDE